MNTSYFKSILLLVCVSTGRTVKYSQVQQSQSFTSPVFSWPRGAPRCGVRPGHGSQRSSGVRLGVENIGGGRWRVTVPGSFKGVIINSASQGNVTETWWRNIKLYSIAGNWESPGYGFQVKSNCVTHSNSGQKSSPSFIFKASNSNTTPSFNGYVVFAKNSYAALN